MSELNPQQIARLKVVSTIIKNANRKQLSKLQYSNRPSHAILSDIKKKNNKCVVCGELRAIDMAHILPVTMVLDIRGYEHLSKSIDNIVPLCKNDHWYFDHNLSTREELEKIYQYGRSFMVGNVLQLLNMEIVPESDKMPRSRKEKMIRWIKRLRWLGDNLFIKNV
jgi:predicted restriction endonuclease